MKLMWLISGLFVAATAVPVPVVSQVAKQVASISERDAAVLNREVSVQLLNVSLKRALQAIASNAKIHIEYQVELVDAVHEPVTIRANRSPLSKVLMDALAGTSLRPVVTAPDAIALQPSIATTPALDGIVVGKVIHAKTKEPVPNARIVLDGEEQGVTTNSQGEFRITATPGDHVVHVRAVGMLRHAERVQVKENETVTLQITLNVSASVLDEVIVTGTVVATKRKAIATPITIIKGEDLEKRGITRIDQLFRGEIPGLLALEDGSAAYGVQLGGIASSRVYTRGSADLRNGTNPIKTYIDGVELLDPEYLGTIDPMSIERIEVVTGPQAATIYGSGAMGGVMQIFTKQGNARGTAELTLNLKYGMLQNNFSDGYAPTHNDVLMLSGGIGPALSYSGSASHVYTGQWQPKLFSRRYGLSIGATHTNGAFTASTSISTTFGANGTWSNSQGTSYGFLKYLEDGTFMPRSTLTMLEHVSQQKSTSSSQTVSLNFDYRVTPTWQHHLTVGRSQNTFTLIPTVPNFTTGASGRIGSDTLYRTESSVGQRTTINYNTTFISNGWESISSTLTLGGNGSLGDRQGSHGCLATAVSTSMIGCSGGSSAPRITRTLNARNVGGFMSWQLGLFQKFYLTLGLRGEHSPSYGRSHRVDWTPTNGATYTIELGDVTVKFLGSYGSATRPPTDDQRRAQLGRNAIYNIPEYYVRLEAPDLRPERSRGPQGGIEFYYGNRGSLTINHYQQKVTDLIQNLTADSLAVIRLSDNLETWVRQTRYVNVATVRQFGWEGTGALNIGAFQVKGTYFWNESRVLSVYPEYGVNEVGQQSRGVPTHAGNITIGYAQGGTRFTLVTNYVGKSWHTRRQDGRFISMQFYARHSQYSDTWNGRLFDSILHPAYTKSDVAASQRLSQKVSMTLNVVNLGNSFASDGDRLNPSLGRQTSFGLSLRY